MARGFIDGEYQDGEVRGMEFIIGNRGYGKTCEMIRLMDQCTGRVWMFDTIGTHAHLFKAPTVHQPEDLRKLAMTQRRLRYVPLGGDRVLHFRSFCALARGFGNVVLGADELNEFCDPVWGRSWMPPELNGIVQYGRHWRIAMIGSARELPSVSKAYRQSCEHFRMFNLTDPDYLREVGKVVGRDVAAKLPSLPKFKYLLWRKGGSGAELKGKLRKV